MSSNSSNDQATSSGYISTSGTISNGYYDPSIKAFDPSPYYPRPKGTALSSVDKDGKIDMSHNNIHIQPANNGFVVTMYTMDDGISTYCFSDYKGVADFLNELSLMDIDSERVADNV